MSNSKNKQILNEMHPNDLHFRRIMNYYDKGTPSTKKQVAIVVTGNKNANRTNVMDALGDMDYRDILDTEKMLKLKDEGVVLNEGLGTAISKIRNLAVKVASQKLDSAQNHLKLDKIQKEKPNGKVAMAQAEMALTSQGNLDEDLKSIINKLAVKIGTSSSYGAILSGLLSAGSWFSYLEATFMRFYYSEIQKLAEPEVFRVMQDLYGAKSVEGSMWGKFGMYAFFIFFVIALVSLAVARASKQKNEDEIPGGLAKGMTLADIANHHKVDIDELMKELELGIKTELEHTTDRKVAEEIAMDHLYENPKYYTKLVSMEKNEIKESAIAFRINEPAVEKFLKKYPRVNQIMSTLVGKNKDVMKGYKAFLKLKDSNEDYLGGKAEVSSSPTFGTKTFYKYDWNGVGGWAEVYQYIHNQKNESVNESVKVKMNALDWGKSTAERNTNMDKYDSLKTDKERETFLRKLKGESVNEAWDAKNGKVMFNGKAVGEYDFDTDSDSFWVMDLEKGKGQKSFDTKQQMIDYFKKHKKNESVTEGFKHIRTGEKTFNNNVIAKIKSLFPTHKSIKAKSVPQIGKVLYIKDANGNNLGHAYIDSKNGVTIDIKESVNEGDEKSPEEILMGLKQMAMGDLERIEDYAEMISDRMKEGQELSSWMYSQITLAVDQLNSVHDAMDGKDGVKESVTEAKTYKKGDKLRIKLPNGKKFDVVFDEYSNTKGIAYGKFKIDGEVVTKPFSISSIVESVNESTPDQVIKDLDKAKNDLLKKVDVLIAKKKKLYSDVDIEAPMSADEKKLDKDIADLFSQINKLVLQKRSIKKESVNEENEPTNPALWDKAIAAAKRKYDVYPSAYANAFASKWYKEKGGDWRTKKESVNEAKSGEFEIGDFVHFKSANKTGMVKKISGDKITIMTMKGDYTGDIKDIKVLYQDEVQPIKEAGPCWKGYKQIGMKKKGGKEVPNCVPESVDLTESKFSEIDIMAKEAGSFQKFVKDFYKEYSQLPKDRETMKWLEGLYKSSIEESYVDSDGLERAALALPQTKEDDKINEDCGCNRSTLTEGVAKEILTQLGGNKFIAMTGAKGLIDGGKYLAFKLPRAKDGINYVKIVLTSMDLYDIEFGRIRANEYKVVKKVDGVYNDQLQSIFTKVTGLYTRL